MVCWGTLYQLCIPVVDKTAETVAKCVAERWIQYFGPPLVIIADQGKEFVGTQFKEFTNANSILLLIIDVRATWQNGRTERHGDIYEKIVERAVVVAFPEQFCGTSALGSGMQCCQESTVQLFRIFSSPANVRDWTPSSRELDQ